MFGEKPIVGQTILRIDKSDRITLPSFTYAEPGEKISSMIDPYGEKLILMTHEEMKRTIEGYMEKIKIYRERVGMTREEFHFWELFFYAILPQADKILNQKAQFLLYSKKKENCPDVEELRKLNFRPDEVFVVGVGNTLEIYQSEEAYQLSLHNKRMREAKRQGNV